MLSPLHKRLLNDYQQDFPLSPTPYLDIAKQLGVSEQAVLQAFAELEEWQQLSRIGAVVAPNRVTASTLAAMAVPEADLLRVAELINQYPEVNHNYERENHYNLWFVLVACDETRLAEVLKDIERRSGYPVMSLPLQADYFIDLGFPLDWHD